MNSLEVILVPMYFHALMYPNAQCLASKESTFHISDAQNMKRCIPLRLELSCKLSTHSFTCQRHIYNTYISIFEVLCACHNY